MECPNLIAKYELELKRKEEEREKRGQLRRSSRYGSCVENSTDKEKKENNSSSLSKGKSDGKKEVFKFHLFLSKSATV